MARVVSLVVDDNGFFVATDDPVELVTDDAVMDDGSYGGCWPLPVEPKPAESERTEIQATWFSPV